MLNPADFKNGKFNPFVDPQLPGEAMNYLVDRNYIVQEIYKGLAIPKYTALTTVFPDYARYADIVRGLEAKYAYDKDKANEIISARMEELGATRENDRWTYNGEPVTLTILIRVEDNRNAIGDYVANELESIGFTVDRQYKTFSEASPIWNQGDPADGLWHIYTASSKTFSHELWDESAMVNMSMCQEDKGEVSRMVGACIIIFSLYLFPALEHPTINQPLQ